MTSLRWTAPEHALDGYISFKTDAYSFGMTIYEVCFTSSRSGIIIAHDLSQILSGQIPFHDTPGDVNAFRRVYEMHERPPKEPDSSPGGKSYTPVWSVAEKCWAKEPNDRPSMDKALELLNEAANQ